MRIGTDVIVNLVLSEIGIISAFCAFVLPETAVVALVANSVNCFSENQFGLLLRW